MMKNRKQEEPGGKHSFGMDAPMSTWRWRENLTVTETIKIMAELSCDIPPAKYQKWKTTPFHRKPTLPEKNTAIQYKTLWSLFENTE